MTAMESGIRPAVPTNLSAVAEIFTHYVCHSVITFEKTPPPVAAWRRRLDDLAAQKLPFLVAELSGEVVGYAYAAPWVPSPPIGAPSRTRSTSPQTGQAKVWAERC
ncbi:GNAT family N-acetyltransferase [Streptomyces griseus]|uniref:GNAT family N-acetyltransferase n=2 Tax=Streptomyces griseus TaxID=1911 RepID=UPI0037944674